MPLVNMRDMLKKAYTERYAVGNFDVFNIEMLKGVLEAAEETRSPVILAYVEGFEDYISSAHFAPVAVRMAQAASVPVALHLDHAVTIEGITRALDSGFTSIMIDASSRPLEENIEITQRVATLCQQYGATIEAELGHVTGTEGDEGSDFYQYTDVEETKRFVSETNVDALAVAIGTVHGVYKSVPVLRIDRLCAIDDAVKIPLVLHGGSGLSDEDFRATIQNGIAKANIYTDLLLAAQGCIRSDATNESLSYMQQCNRIVQAIKQATMIKMDVFGCCGKAR